MRRHVELAFVMLWGADSERSRERRAKGLGVPLQGGPGRLDTSSARGPFPGFQKTLPSVAGLDFEGCPTRSRWGDSWLSARLDMKFYFSY